jgi:hypothetical protein
MFSGATCLFGTLHWFLVDTRGPKNIAIAAQSLGHIHDAFAACGILKSAIIKPLNAIILNDEWP